MAVNYYYMNIKGSTNIVGLIGHPVEHSFSPPMHNAAFQSLGMDYAYVAFDVNPNDLSSAIEGARSLNIKGFNVTIPHKIEVMQYLNELDEVAELIGAVNTIDFKNLKGYNTDGIGAIKAIEEVTKVKDKDVIVAGAGGASDSAGGGSAHARHLHALRREFPPPARAGQTRRGRRYRRPPRHRGAADRSGHGHALRGGAAADRTAAVAAARLRKKEETETAR